MATVDANVRPGFLGPLGLKGPSGRRRLPSPWKRRGGRTCEPLSSRTSRRLARSRRCAIGMFYAIFPMSCPRGKPENSREECDSHERDEGRRSVFGERVDSHSSGQIEPKRESSSYDSHEDARDGSAGGAGELAGGGA